MDVHPSAWPNELLTGVGVLLAVAGLVAVGYATYLAMIRAAPYGWYDRAGLMAPLGLVLLIGGLVLQGR